MINFGNKINRIIKTMRTAFDFLNEKTRSGFGNYPSAFRLYNWKEVVGYMEEYVAEVLAEGGAEYKTTENPIECNGIEDDVSQIK